MSYRYSIYIKNGWYCIRRDVNGRYDLGEANRLCEAYKKGTKKMTNVINLFGGPGTGKCFGKDTKILMYNGNRKKIQDIILNDEVMGYDSCPRTVNNIIHGNGKLYKIIPNKGDSYIVNEDHILSLKFNHHDKEKTINISVKEFLTKSKWYQSRCKGYKVGIEFINKYEKKIDPYFLGLWLGDGDSNSQRITNIDNEVIDYIYNYADKLNMKVTKTGKRGCHTYAISNGNIGGKPNYILTNLREYNLLQNKHIPFNYISSTDIERLELLAGIIDTDGYIKKNNCNITLKSKKLTDDIVFLCNTLGFNSFYKEVFKRATNSNDIGKIYYKISLIGDLSRIPTKIKRKQVKICKRNTHPLRTGINVEYIGEGNYYGFSLNEECKLFCLGDCTVTHNSTTTSHLFASLKLDDINCELAREYAKDKVWEESFTTLNDQLYVFAKQYHRQFILLDKVEYIISDSPLLLSLIYGRNKTDTFKQLVVEMFHSFDNTNIFLVRTKQYQPAGRYTTEDRALDIDEEILEILDEYEIPYTKVLADKTAYKTIRSVLGV